MINGVHSDSPSLWQRAGPRGCREGSAEFGSRRGRGAGCRGALSDTLTGPPNHVVNGDASRFRAGKLDVPNSCLMDDTSGVTPIKVAIKAEQYELK